MREKENSGEIKNNGKKESKFQWTMEKKIEGKFINLGHEEQQKSKERETTGQRENNRRAKREQQSKGRATEELRESNRNEKFTEESERAYISQQLMD